MTAPIRVFVGYDSREPAAYAVCCHSILTRASVPVSLAPICQEALRASGLYWRDRGSTESTEFSLTRFLVPALCGFEGDALFVDCDFLFQADIADLFANLTTEPEPAVFVCQHDYVPRDAQKFLGQAQTSYPRKNWSSLMLFRTARCRALTPEFVNAASGLELHRFLWTTDPIGRLPLDWNWLVGEYTSRPDARALHFTLGGPFHGSQYLAGEEAERWVSEFKALCGLTPVGAIIQGGVSQWSASRSYPSRLNLSDPR